jgi:hypothetical protein
LAGFDRAEALKFFGSPPAGYRLVIEPLSPKAAQARYLQRCHVLTEAAGFDGAPAAFDSE